MANTPIGQLPSGELISTVSGNLRVTAFSTTVDFANSSLINIISGTFIPATGIAGTTVLWANSAASNGLYYGSNPIVIQSGSVTAGHLVTWNSSGSVVDGGAITTYPIVFGTGAPSAQGGTSTTASGNNAIAYGASCIASGQYSVAFTDSATASAEAAIAMGVGSNAGGLHAIALGFGASAQGNYSIALGRVATASQSGVFAIADSIGNPYSNSTSDTFTATFANGYNFNVNSTTQGVNINGQGTLLPQQGFTTGKTTYSTGTISQTGVTVTGTGTTFTSGMVGGLFVPAIGSPCLITAFSSAISITVSVSQTIASLTSYKIIYGGTQIDNLGNFSTGNLYAPSGMSITANGNLNINNQTIINNTAKVNILSFNSGGTSANSFTWQTGNAFPFFGSNAVCLQSGSVTGGHLASWNATGVLQDAGLAISLNSLQLNSTASTVSNGFTWNSANIYPTFGTNIMCLQSGSVTAGHLVSWNANGVIQDAGSTVTINALAFNSGSTIANAFTWNSANAYPSWGTSPVCTQSGSITSGHVATWNANGVLVDGGVFPSGGYLWNSSATNNIWNSTANSIATTNTNCTAIGVGATAGTTIGTNGALAVGPSSSATSTNTVAVGNGATANSQFSTAIGVNAHAQNSSAAAFGNAAFATGTSSLALGFSCTAAGSNSIAFSNATANGATSIAMGFQATTNNTGSFVCVDSNFGTLTIASDTSSNQWVGSFQGGYNFYLSAASTPLLAVQIDTSGNLNAKQALVVTGNSSLSTASTSGLATLNSLAVTNTSTLTGNLIANGTANQIFGRTTAQTAGYVGEIISSSGAGTGLTAANTNTNIASISLTPGIWDIKGNLYFSAASGMTVMISAFSTTSAALPAATGLQSYYLFPSSSKYGASVPPQTLTVTSTTTVYLVAQAAMSGSTANSNYNMYAVRVA